MTVKAQIRFKHQMGDCAEHTMLTECYFCGQCFKLFNDSSGNYSFNISRMFTGSLLWASRVVLVVKNLPINAGDINGNPLWYSCLENPHGQRSLAGCSPQGHRVGHDWARTEPHSLQLVDSALAEAPLMQAADSSSCTQIFDCKVCPCPYTASLFKGQLYFISHFIILF